MHKPLIALASVALVTALSTGCSLEPGGAQATYPRDIAVRNTFEGSAPSSPREAQASSAVSRPWSPATPARLRAGAVPHL